MSPFREKFSRKPHCVALAIFREDKVLLGLEAESNQFHNLSWNIQTETLKRFFDLNFKMAAARGLHEELSAPMKWFSLYPGSKREISEWYSEIGTRLTFHCACLHYEGKMGNADTLFRPKNRKEIITHQWFPLNQLPDTLEMGARFLIEEYRKMLKL
jgi:hypothetical protein